MNYETIFEISQSSNGILGDFYFRVTIGIVALILGVIGIYLKAKGRDFWKRGWYPPIFLVFWGFAWTFAHVYLTNSKDTVNTWLKIYNKKQYEIVEGPVEVISEQPKNGHAKGDIIRIRGIEFEIDYFVVTPTYRKTISHGGALKHGEYVKVYYYKGRILRIDKRL